MYEFNELQEILKAGSEYNTPVKAKIRKNIINKYILPKVRKGQEVNVLDFFGTGKFVEELTKMLDDQTSNVNNHGDSVNLYEVEQNKLFQKYMRDYVDQSPTMGNQKDHVNIIPFPGSLVEFVQGITVNNQTCFDFLWLDYCGMEISEEDMQSIKKITSIDSVIGITLSMVARSSTHYPLLRRQKDLHVKDMFQRHFPLMTTYRMNTYENMLFYIAKVPNYIKRLEVKPNVVQEIDTRPSIGHLGLLG